MNLKEQQKEQVNYDEFEKMPQFQGQHPDWNLLQGVASFGFERPSEIQQQTIVPIYQGRNVIGQAQSGRGKTGAFVIGSLSLIDQSVNAVQVIIIANTHELARQTESVINGIGCKILKPSDVELCVGRQVAVEDNIKHIRDGCKVLVGTPGRIKHLVFHSINGEPIIKPSNVKIVILDEADCLLMDKFRDVVVDIIDRLDSNPKFPLQLGIFSATFSDESLDISRSLCVPEMKSLGDEWRNDPRAPFEILIPVEDLTLDGIEQFYYTFDCAPNDTFAQKTDFIILLNSIQMIPMCIIYVNSRQSAIRLKEGLDRENMRCQCIYGSMTPTQRQEITRAFRDCNTRILIATDLLARGFDVQQVELVINFDLPYVQDRNTGEVNKEKMAEYLHRIGRGGRFGRKGMAISLIGNATEKSRKEAIEAHFDTKMQVLPEDIAGLY
jgi:translation initiation factor 4A